jgi:transcriptional regulator of met regulon
LKAELSIGDQIKIRETTGNRRNREAKILKIIASSEVLIFLKCFVGRPVQDDCS